MLKKKITKVKTEMARLKSAIADMEQECEEAHGSYWGPKQTGAVRRASMDLTRALSDLRRSKWE